MKLRDLAAKPRILCHVNSGSIASFWFDNWTGLGSLIDVIGELGPQVSGISIDSSVAEAVVAGAWSSTRSRNPTLLRLRQALPSTVSNINFLDPDYYLWRNSVAFSFFYITNLNFLEPYSTIGSLAQGGMVQQKKSQALVYCVDSSERTNADS